MAPPQRYAGSNSGRSQELQQPARNPLTRREPKVHNQHSMIGLGPTPALRSTPTKRRHDLDALRSFAMLLGLGLHAATPFVAYWNHNDPDSIVMLVFVRFVHGFRMPLFFMLSGFFTMMVWRQRGLGALMKHRAIRIAVPLAIGSAILLPAVNWSSQWSTQATQAQTSEPASEASANPDAAADNQPGDVLAYSGQQSHPTDLAGETQAAPKGLLSFHHLWFLWMLVLLGVGFTAVAVASGLIRSSIRQRARLHPKGRTVVVWVLLALPVLPYLFMADTGFGPETSDRLIPKLHVLAYYACFFAFGTLAHGNTNTPGSADTTTNSDSRRARLLDQLSVRWPALLGFGVLVLFPVGTIVRPHSWLAASITQVGFAWVMSLGLIGAFRHFFSADRPSVRYMSDASYWLYLIHFPLVPLIQVWFYQAPIPPTISFVFIFSILTMVGLFSYHLFVRYSPIGTVLNGRRTRQHDQATLIWLQRRSLPKVSDRG